MDDTPPGVNANPPSRTQWHRLLGKLLELLLTAVGITVQTEVPITSDPPKVDILLLRREQAQWTAAQLALLCDGLRDTVARTLLVEFKFSESLCLCANICRPVTCTPTSICCSGNSGAGANDTL